MENVIIEGSRNTYFTPDVILDAQTGRCSITGESYLEEPYAFYQRMVDWFKEYTNTKADPLEINFKMAYFNTSSSRAILEMLREIRNFQQAGCKVLVNWYYPNPDYDEMLMEGEDFMGESGCEINLVEYTLDK